MKLSPEQVAKCEALATPTATRWPAPAGTLAAVELPLPPSTNNLFCTKGRKRVKTAKYRQWTDKALPILRKLKPAAPPVEIVLTIRGKVNAQRDSDNFLKPIGDALKQAGVIADDNVTKVTGWTVRVTRDGSEPRAVVEVRTMGD